MLFLPFDEMYASQPLEIFAIWHGGLAIQGGIFAGLIYSYYFFKKHDIPLLLAGDAIMPGVLIAQALEDGETFSIMKHMEEKSVYHFCSLWHLPQFIIDNMLYEWGISSSYIFI